MKRILLAIVVLAVVTLACATGAGTPKPSLYPSPTAELTQTPFVLQITTTPMDTATPLVVVVSETPSGSRLCVNALVSVHLRPSPSTENYPITVIPNGMQLVDLGGRSEKWLFVQFNDMHGWVHADYVGDC